MPRRRTTATPIQRSAITYQAREAHRALIRLTERELNGNPARDEAITAWERLAALERTAGDVKRIIALIYTGDGPP